MHFKCKLVFLWFIFQFYILWIVKQYKTAKESAKYIKNSVYFNVLKIYQTRIWNNHTIDKTLLILSLDTLIHWTVFSGGKNCEKSFA